MEIIIMGGKTITAIPPAHINATATQKYKHARHPLHQLLAAARLHHQVLQPAVTATAFQVNPNIPAQETAAMPQTGATAVRATLSANQAKII